MRISCFFICKIDHLLGFSGTSTAGNNFYHSEFTGNVVYHLGNDLGSGRIATFGVILFLTGLAAHGARRRGQQTATAITRRKFLLGDQPAKKD